MKQSHFGVRLPTKLKEDIKEAVNEGRYLNPSEFARQALREKLEREKKGS